MDEQEYIKTYRQANNLPCVFAKAILRRCSDCSRAEKVYIAEREAVACHSPGARDRCQRLIDILRPKALFALKITEANGALPHAKEVKVQCGGMLGLQQALHPELEGAERVEDIHGLLVAAEERYGALEALPYSRLMPTINHFTAREKRR